jgi:two-component system response regulator YesN
MLSRTHLQMLDIDSDEAASGAEALELLKNNDYGGVIVDYSMPGMTGLELTEKINGRIPVIILTSEGFSLETEKELKNSAAGYIIKPLTEEKLKKSLAKIFEDKNFDE